MIRRRDRNLFVQVIALAGGLVAMASAATGAPDNTARMDAAAKLLLRGDPARAITAYTEALDDPAVSNDRRASLLNDRGVAYMRAGQPKLAIEDFNKAATLFPEYAVVYNNRGNLLLSLGLLKEAIKDLDRAIVLAPGFASAYNNRAGAYVRQGQLNTAIADYTKAIQLMPQNPAPLAGRGRVHLAERRPHAAIRDFSRAVASDARFAAGYRNRAEAKLQVEHYEEAIEDLSRAIAFDVSNAEIYVLRGQAYLAVRNTESALKDFSQAIALDPKLASAYEERGLAYGFAQYFDKAYADLNRAIELDPRSALAFAYRAFVYKQNGQIDVGQRDVEAAIKLNPKRAEVMWAKAALEEAQGQSDQAIADLRKALGTKSGYRDAIDALQRLGQSVAETGSKELAGSALPSWRVLEGPNGYVAIDDEYPNLSVPLEMLGAGQPKLLEWEVKQPPYKGVGTLRFFAGRLTRGDQTEDIEQVALIDLTESKVIAIEPHRQGTKVANWTWEDGKVTVAAVDGLNQEFDLRVERSPLIAAPGGPRTPSAAGGKTYGTGWAPWNEPWAGGATWSASKQRTSQGPKKKPKTLFDMLFN